MNKFKVRWHTMQELWMKVLSEKFRGWVGLRHIVLTVNVLTHEHPLWQHAVRGFQFHLVGFVHLDVSTITVIQCGGWVRTPHHRPSGLLTRTCPLKHSSWLRDSSVKTRPKLFVPVSNPHLNEIYSLIYNLGWIWNKSMHVYFPEW